MNRNKFPALVLFILIISGCQKNDPGESVVAAIYLNDVLDIMENNSINRKNITWTDFRSTITNQASHAQTSADTYPAIKNALGLLADNHSFFLTPQGQYILNSRLSCTSASAPDVVPPANVGYVRVPAFSPQPNSPEAAAFVQGLQDKIRLQDNTNLIGWIVDLRGNTGGDMWPMVAGIGSILGEGVSGYFIDPEDNAVPWSYSSGSSMSGNTIMSSVASPYQLLNPNPKVAVLIDGATASSGEAVAISFIGRPNTKLFGSSGTCGLSTSNQVYNLSDGAALILTTATMADRNHTKYGGPVQPDQFGSGGTDGVVTAALAWLGQ